MSSVAEEAIPTASRRPSSGRASSRRRILWNLAWTGFRYLLLILLALVVLIPFYWMFLTSIQPLSEVFVSSIRWIPRRITFSAYVDAFTSPALPFGRLFLNSVFVATSVTVLQILTSSLAAYSFARLRYPGRDKLFLVYLATLMIPAQVTMIPNFIVLKTLGWIDTYQGLILPMAFNPFGVFLLRQYFLTIPYELEDAARIDGASFFQCYWHIILPLSGPAVAALSIFTFLAQWNEFLWPLIVTNKLEMFTLSVGLQYFQGLEFAQWPQMMATSLASMLPVLIVYLFQQRRFVQGIALTGLTGR